MRKLDGDGETQLKLQNTANYKELIPKLFRRIKPIKFVCIFTTSVSAEDLRFLLYLKGFYLISLSRHSKLYKSFFM